MGKVLLGLYMVNSVLLINHEIDSAYWKEWELFKLPGGLTGFLGVHFPFLFLILLGVVLVYRDSWSGFIFSFALCFCGLFAFTVHTYFLGKGRREFNKPISKFILVAILLVSLVQVGTTVYVMLMT